MTSQHLDLQNLYEEELCKQEKMEEDFKRKELNFQKQF